MNRSKTIQGVASIQESTALPRLYGTCFLNRPTHVCRNFGCFLGCLVSRRNRHCRHAVTHRPLRPYRVDLGTLGARSNDIGPQPARKRTMADACRYRQHHYFRTGFSFNVGLSNSWCVYFVTCFRWLILAYGLHDPTKRQLRQLFPNSRNVRSTMRSVKGRSRRPKHEYYGYIRRPPNTTRRPGGPSG